MPLNVLTRCKSCTQLIRIDVPDIADESATVKWAGTRAMCNLCNAVHDYTEQDILND
jgi:hypothetical protein